MRVETPAFILRTYSLGEADRIVVAFSRAEGKLRGVAPRAASSRRRFGGALAVLAEVEMSFSQRPGRELGRVESCRLLTPTPGEGRDLAAYYAAAYMAEILEPFSREGEADDELYRLTRSVAAALAAGLQPRALIRYFEIWTLRLAGLLPALESCCRCAAALARQGAVLTPEAEPLCCRCAGGPVQIGRRLGPAAVALIQAIIRQPPEVFARALQTPGDLTAVAGLAEAFFLHQVERPFRTAEPVSGWPGAGSPLRGRAS